MEIRKDIVYNKNKYFLSDATRGGSRALRKKTICLWLLVLSLLLGGCAAPSAAAVAEQTVAIPAIGSLFGKKQETETDAGPYVAPEFLDAAFHEDLSEGDDRVRLDLSALSDGVVAVSARSDKRLKFQVIKGEETYNYNLASDGTPSVFPLQSGDGEYRFRVMENVADKKYAEVYSKSVNVTLADPFGPFLRPSDYVNYNRNSDCVKKAEELAQTAGTPLGLVSKVYAYVCKNVKYDDHLAQTVQSGYLPVPDETLKSGKGICFDYAALAASMLRSQGIPTRMVFGYVAPDQLYHAWNMFYTEETGWVTVKFEVSADSWVRLDLTFAANGADNKFIGDGSNYADVYYY